MLISGQYLEFKPGQYHEVNPGQYNEVNPGQYHEDSPGQYHENSPGQYHESNPGQYHEVHPGQYTHVPDDEVEVEVERVAGIPNRRVYNVQSKVDQFIIGEYGTINENSGQTLKGVRYTAVDDSTVDPKIIFDTLQKYFQFSWVSSERVGPLAPRASAFKEGELSLESCDDAGLQVVYLFMFPSNNHKRCNQTRAAWPLIVTL